MRAYVGVGTNLGDRWAYLSHAVRELSRSGVQVARASRVYDTKALDPRQPRFLNAVLELDTTLTPEGLLERLLAVEASAGRTRETQCGPRTLDLDLLLYDDVIRRSQGLTLPHPGLLSRRFVLGPLAELCPDRRVPGTVRTVADLLRTAPEHEMTTAGLYPGAPGSGAAAG